MKILLSIPFFILFINISAQDLGNSQLKGICLDLETGDTLRFATLMLYSNDSLYAGTESNVDGCYVFQDISPGRYILSTRYLGYSDLDEDVRIQFGTNSHTPLLVSSQHVLDEIVVTECKITRITCQLWSCGTRCFGGNYTDTENSEIRFGGMGNHLIDSNSSKNISIYPNPADASITMDTGGRIDSYQLYTFGGRQVLRANIDPETKLEVIPTHQLMNGTYLVLLFKNEKLLASEKLVVAH